MIPFVLAAVALATAIGALNRRRSAKSMEREYTGRFPADANGVAQGAEGFALQGTNGRRLLLLHGSGDSPQSLRYLAARLNAAGYDVHAPLLPGHGRTPHAFATATASDYHDAARSALQALDAAHEWVGVIGLSMGGALAARIATESSGVRALVLLAPYMIPPRDVRIARRTSWLSSSNRRQSAYARRRARTSARRARRSRGQIRASRR